MSFLIWIFFFIKWSMKTNLFLLEKKVSYWNVSTPDYQETAQGFFIVIPIP